MTCLRYPSSVTPLCFLLATALCTLPCQVWMSLCIISACLHEKGNNVGIPAETWSGVLFKCGPNVNWCLLCIDTLYLSCSLSVCILLSSKMNTLYAKEVCSVFMFRFIAWNWLICLVSELMNFSVLSFVKTLVKTPIVIQAIVLFTGMRKLGFVWNCLVWDHKCKPRLFWCSTIWKWLSWWPLGYWSCR